MSGFARSENMEKGRGFFDGLEVLVSDAGYALYDAEGKWENPSVCFFMEMNSEKMEEPIMQYWSIGKPDDFKPTKDGNALVAGKKLNERCNFAYLVKSLENAGIPTAVLDGIDEDASVIIGYRFRMTTVIKNKADKYGTPVVDEILDGPEAPIDVEATTKALVIKVVTAGGGKVPMRSVPKLVKDAAEGFGDEAAKAIHKMVASKGFLAGVEGVKIDGTNLIAA